MRILNESSQTTNNLMQSLNTSKESGQDSSSTTTGLNFNPFKDSDSAEEAHFELVDGKLTFRDGDTFNKDNVLGSLKACVEYSSNNSIELFKSPSERNDMVIKLCKMFSWPTDIINTSLELNPETIDLLDSSYGVDINRKVQLNNINQSFVSKVEKGEKYDDDQNEEVGDFINEDI